MFLYFPPETSHTQEVYANCFLFVYCFSLGYIHPTKIDTILYDPKLILFNQKEIPVSRWNRTQMYRLPARLLLVYGYYSREEGKILRNRHRIAMCPISKGETNCYFEGELRSIKMQNHACDLLKEHTTTTLDHRQPLLRQFLVSSVPPQTDSTNSRGKALPPLKKETTDKLLEFIGSSAISFRDIDSLSFRALCLSLVSAGQQHPTIPPDKLLPEMERHSLSQLMSNQASIPLNDLFRIIEDGFVSVQFDAAKIITKTYLIVTIAPVDESTPPLFFQLNIAPSQEVPYIQFLTNLFGCLSLHNVVVGSICTDGCPTQRAGIAQFLSSLRDSSHHHPFEVQFIPLMIWCHNHLVNLITQTVWKDPITEPTANRVYQIVCNFAEMSHRRKLRELLGEVCPTIINTRWLSVWLVCSFIRLHRNVIASSQLLARGEIVEILKLELLLSPLMELQLFFENDQTRMYHVFPVVMRTIQQYLLLASHPSFSSTDWLIPVVFVLHNCIKRFFLPNKHTLWPEITLSLHAFSLTPVGQHLYGLGAFGSGFNLNDSLDGMFEVQFVLFVELFTLSLFDLARLVV